MERTRIAPGAGAGQAGLWRRRGAGGLHRCGDGAVVGRGRNRENRPDRTGPPGSSHCPGCRTLGVAAAGRMRPHVTWACPMCARAIVNARIPAVYYGAKDDKAGCCGSVLNLFEGASATAFTAGCWRRVRRSAQEFSVFALI